MRRRAKVDRNHAELVTALRQCGWRVCDTSRVGGGFPDVLVARGGIVRLVEFKDRKGKLTPDQEAFHGEFPVVIVRTVDECAALR